MIWPAKIALVASLVFAPNLNYASDLPARALDVMAHYLYVREATNRNDHPVIERWLRKLGLPPRQSWCMAAVIGCYDEAAGGRGPLPRSGRCATVLRLAKRDQLRFKVIQPRQILAGAYQLQPGDVTIWASGRVDAAQDFNGHTGLVISQRSPQTFFSREGNTQPGPGGNQREGGGLYDRQRSLGLASSFAVQGFIRPL